MVRCIAYGCKSRSDQNEPGVTFHRFPKNEDKCKIWIENMEIKDWTRTENDRLCSLHFETHWFYNTEKTKRLLNEAVPTIFPDLPGYLQPKKSDPRSPEMSSGSSEEEAELTRPSLHRVAKKSTTTTIITTKPYSTRRIPGSGHQKTLNVANRFLENFNPETSIREKRKLNRKINPPSNIRRPPGALYDENGVHIASCTDLCDCLIEDCVGCFFLCPKCGSQKCGIDCRVHRKYVYDQLEYHGYDIIVKNPLLKN